MEMLEEMSPPVYVLVQLGILTAVVLVISQISSLISGWKRLANLYPTSGDPEGEAFHWRSLKLGRWGYRRCINLAAGRNGLRLSATAPIRFGHAPVFMPWSEITAKAHKGLFFSSIDLHPNKAPELRIRLHRRLAEALLRAGGPAAPKTPEPSV